MNVSIGDGKFIGKLAGRLKALVEKISVQSCQRFWLSCGPSKKLSDMQHFIEKCHCPENPVAMVKGRRGDLFLQISIETVRARKSPNGPVRTDSVRSKMVRSVDRSGLDGLVLTFGANRTGGPDLKVRTGLGPDRTFFRARKSPLNQNFRQLRF